MFGRNKVAMLVAEFLGAGVLTLVVLSVQHSNIGVSYFVALAAGITVAVLMVAFARVSGGHFNPAITLGLWTTRQVKTLAAVAYIAAQLLGAWAAYYLYTYFVKTSLQTIGGHYDGHILVAEAVGAFVLSLAWAAAVFNKYLNAKTATTVGAALMIGMIIASSASAGLINPAVALGTRAWDVFGAMGWGTYVLGPVLGSVIGFNLYALLFAPNGTLAGMTRASLARPSSSTSSASITAPAKKKPAAKKKKSSTRKSK